MTNRRIALKKMREAGKWFPEVNAEFRLVKHKVANGVSTHVFGSTSDAIVTVYYPDDVCLKTPETLLSVVAYELACLLNPRNPDKLIVERFEKLVETGTTKEEPGSGGV